MSTRNPREITQSIIQGLDVRAEYEAMGIKFSGNVRQSGNISCFAVGRPDNSPSAWVNVTSGYFGDSGNTEVAASTCSLFDFAVRVGKFPDWKDARRFYAAKANVTLARGPGAADKNDWRPKLEFQSWLTPGNDTLATRWCLKVKPGVTLEAIKAAGGQMAYWPCFIDKQTKEKKRAKNCHQVIAFPGFGEWGLAADPVCWQIFDVTGRYFDVTPKDAAATDPRRTAKDLSIGPSGGTLMGLSSLMMLTDPERRAKVELVWKVEGPSDLLALWASLPAEKRETIAIVTQLGGATADVMPWQVKMLAGLRVAIVCDKDTAGIIGGHKWDKALHSLCESVRMVDLPFITRESHGLDCRDFLNGTDETPRP